MGLNICRTIVEAHGGRIWAENNHDRGATFVFELPVFSSQVITHQVISDQAL
jgi:signal transduction histidine kinase